MERGEVRGSEVAQGRAICISKVAKTATKMFIFRFSGANLHSAPHLRDGRAQIQNKTKKRRRFGRSVFRRLPKIEGGSIESFFSRRNSSKDQGNIHRSTVNRLNCTLKSQLGAEMKTLPAQIHEIMRAPKRNLAVILKCPMAASSVI